MPYTDLGDTSEYAVTALQWAMEQGIINGMGDNTVCPSMTATRAQVAQMIVKYLK